MRGRGVTIHYARRSPDELVCKGKAPYPGRVWVSISATELIDDLQELVDAAGPVGSSAFDGIANAFAGVVAEHADPDTLQRRRRGSELLQDLDAHPRLRNHSLHALNLSLDFPQPDGQFFLMSGIQHVRAQMRSGTHLAAIARD